MLCQMGRCVQPCALWVARKLCGSCLLCLMPQAVLVAVGRTVRCQVLLQQQLLLLLGCLAQYHGLLT